MKSETIFAEENLGLTVGLLAAASLIPILALLHLDPRFPGDDALISLCFAKNLAAGHGFVFNHPPTVLGTTTPLFTLIVALVSALSGAEATVVAFLLSIGSWLGLIWSFFLLRKAFGLAPRAAAMIGVLIALTGWIGHLSMEAYPFALVEVLTAALVFSGRPLAAGLAGGALFLLRGEGILFAAMLGLVVLVSEVRRPKGDTSFSPTLRFVGGVSIPILLWAVYAIPRFGSILPATLAAKMAQVTSGLWAAFPVRLFSEWLPGWGLGWGPHPLRMAIGWGLVLLGLLMIGRSFPRLWIFPAWALAYAAGYSLLGVPGYPWYQLPILLVLAISSAMGLEFLLERLVDSGARRWRQRLGWLLVVGILSAPAIGITHRIRDRQAPERDLAYFNLAHWFRENARPSETIAYMEVGYLGYYTKLGIVDLVGLVSPQYIPYVLRQDFSAGFWESRPEYLVELEGSEFIRPIVRDPRFGPAYGRIAELKGFDGRELRIYRRR